MISHAGRTVYCALGGACPPGRLPAIARAAVPGFTLADVEKMLASLQLWAARSRRSRSGTGGKLIEDSKPGWATRQAQAHQRVLQPADPVPLRRHAQIWGQSDYWATPLETLAKGKGDCEDFTIAKYFTLLEAGLPNEQLRLIYVKARIGGAASNVTQAHMVLAYYSEPDAEPLILDNLITDIRPASRRPDLQPVFSFNSMGIWSNPTASGVPASTGVGD
jgi:predicted transglutaminase-like cysteine proteinase